MLKDDEGQVEVSVKSLGLLRASISQNLICYCCDCSYPEQKHYHH